MVILVHLDPRIPSQQCRRGMSMRSHMLPPHLALFTYLPIYSIDSRRAGVATLRPKYATPAASILPNHPPKVGRKQVYEP